MSNVDVKCPKCGETILFDSDKQKGEVFCPYCGNRMTVEEVLKIAINETQQKIDEMQAKKPTTSNVDSELENLYTLARRAKDTNNIENAQKYYDMILPKDPNNWEPNFYSVYYQAMSCKIAGIVSAAANIKNIVPVVGEMIAAKYGVEKNSINANLECVISETTQKLSEILKLLQEASFHHYLDCIRSHIDYTSQYIGACVECTYAMYYWGATIDSFWGDKYGKYIAYAYSTGIEYHKKFVRYISQEKEFYKEKKIILEKAAIVKKYNPSYQVGRINKDEGGCYIATAVYGSYDCPEVWTLRRYRDYTLNRTWYGRAFIKIYYASSPTLVKWFGGTQWFKKSWSAVLDRFVSKLNSNGYENTPYNDKKW